MKEEHYDEAVTAFEGSKVKITKEGNRHLGAIVGSLALKKKYLENKVNEWIEKLQVLSLIAKSYPHAAYSAFIHGLQHEYTFLMRTIPGISNVTRNTFLKSILNGYLVNDFHQFYLNNYN